MRIGKERVYWPLIFLALTIPACVTNRGRVETRVSAYAERELEAEYSVYSYLLRGSRTPIIVSDSTVPKPLPRAIICFERDSKAGSCSTPAPVAEAWEDFNAKNQVAWILMPLFEKAMNVTLKRDAVLPDETCSVPTVVYFSRVGLNRDLTRAVVTMTSVTGKGPRPGCGVTWGMHLVLERTPEGWKAIGPQLNWVSQMPRRLHKAPSG